MAKQDFKTEFHYNKDWNYLMPLTMLSIFFHFKTEFHYNKDWNPE